CAARPASSMSRESSKPVNGRSSGSGANCGDCADEANGPAFSLFAEKTALRADSGQSAGRVMPIPCWASSRSRGPQPGSLDEEARDGFRDDRRPSGTKEQLDEEPPP